MGKYNDLATSATKREYLPAGKHEVIVGGAEIKLGDEARPGWATKSVSFRLQNDEGVVFWDVELSPLTKKDGEENEGAIGMFMSSIENLGHDFGDVDSVDDFSREVEQFVMNGGGIGARVSINIVKRPSNRINPNTGSPYMNTTVYVNELLEEGTVDAPLAAAAPVADVY